MLWPSGCNAGKIDIKLYRKIDSKINGMIYIRETSVADKKGINNGMANK